MSTDTKIEFIDVNRENVSETGFFCYMSKRNTDGYRKKFDWLQARFDDGMRIKMAKLPARGFIEYLPGEYAWRPVQAGGYMFIHCLWVVGKSRVQGLASQLLQECLREAQEAGKGGVAMVTSEGVWLMNKKLLEKHGFESVDSAPPSFNLMVKKFNGAPDPSFCGDWEQKLTHFGDGLTIVATDQCPYIGSGIEYFINPAREHGIPIQVVELSSAQEVRDRAPSAYGVFSVVYNSQLFSYHYLTESQFRKRLEELKQ